MSRSEVGHAVFSFHEPCRQHGAVLFSLPFAGFQNRSMYLLVMRSDVRPMVISVGYLFAAGCRLWKPMIDNWFGNPMSIGLMLHIGLPP